jgi:hypothetical protein
LSSQVNIYQEVAANSIGEFPSEKWPEMGSFGRFDFCENGFDWSCPRNGNGFDWSYRATSKMGLIGHILLMETGSFGHFRFIKMGSNGGFVVIRAVDAVRGIESSTVIAQQEYRESRGP